MQLENINRLTAAAVAKLPDGKHSDGGYLWLRVKGASRSWVVRGPRKPDGSRVEMGLGSVDRVSLALARKKRDEIVEQWRNGVDPLAEKRKEKEAIANRRTFRKAANDLIDARKKSWRVSALTGKSSTLSQWRHDIDVVCEPLLDCDVATVTVDDIKPIVAPFWDAEHLPRAQDILRRIESVLDYAFAHGWRTSDNAASWRVWKHLSPRASAGKRKKSHPALAWNEVPGFVDVLREEDGASARCLEFLILTATRSQEGRGAQWSEIDLERKVWTVPKERMKRGIKHEVPLSEAALAFLARQPREGKFVFPSGRFALDYDKALLNSSVWDVVKKLVADDVDACVHGFRTAFRTWCDHNGVPEKLAERSIAHEVGDDTQQAYSGIERDQLTEPRRPVMEAWGRFITGQPAGENVVPFQRVA